jgi:hypothetical protein
MSIVVGTTGVLLLTVVKQIQAQAKNKYTEKIEFCPLTSPQDWQQFLENTAHNEKWVETCEDSACDQIFYNYVLRKVDGTLKKCKSVIFNSNQIASCTENLRKFIPAWLRQHDSGSYGFNVDNHTYLSEQESADKPPNMMRIPEAIIAALPDQRKVQEVARENGWKYLTHDSALHGDRTFIYIQDPLQRFDQWMLLNLKGPGEKNIAQGMPVSIVAVQKKTADGHELPKVRLYFRDYSIKELESGVRLSVNETGNGKCYSCHGSGMRQLIPRKTQVLEAKPVFGESWFNQPVPEDFSYRRLAEFNKIIRRYGPNDWDGKIIPEEHGPMLGRNQGCTSCHNGESRGVLTVSTSISQLHRKMVTELSMPPSENLVRYLERLEMKNPALSGLEQNKLKDGIHQGMELAAKFMNSRYPELKGWLLKNSCL